MILPTADSRSVTPGIKLVGGKMQIFVINLPRATERRIFQEEQFKRLSLKFHLLEATCVNKISDETYQKHYRDWQRPLRKTEVACYYSHRFAWKKVIETGKPALILEDDALRSPRGQLQPESSEGNVPTELSRRDVSRPVRIDRSPQRAQVRLCKLTFAHFKFFSKDRFKLRQLHLPGAVCVVFRKQRKKRAAARALELLLHRSAHELDF